MLNNNLSWMGCQMVSAFEAFLLWTRAIHMCLMLSSEELEQSTLYVPMVVTPSSSQLISWRPVIVTRPVNSLISNCNSSQYHCNRLAESITIATCLAFVRVYGWLIRGMHFGIHFWAVVVVSDLISKWAPMAFQNQPLGRGSHTYFMVSELTILHSHGYLFAVCDMVMMPLTATDGPTLWECHCWSMTDYSHGNPAYCTLLGTFPLSTTCQVQRMERVLELKW